MVTITPVRGIPKPRALHLLLAMSFAVAAVGYLLSAPAQSATGPMEAGSIEITSAWTTVPIAGSFTDPVVVAGPASKDESDPGVVEMANVSSNSFDIRFREWGYLDGSHGPETVSYLIVERGVTMLDGGASIEAGTVGLGSSYTQINFSAGLSAKPTVVFTVLDNTVGPVAPRVASHSNSRIRVRQWKEETEPFQPTVDANWIAWSAGSGSVEGAGWETGTVRADERSFTANFGATYDEPCFVGDITSGTSNPVTVRASNPTGSSIDVQATEEQSRDNEVLLGLETISYLVVECGSSEPPPTDTEAPTWSGGSLQAENPSASTVGLSWSNTASDNEAVVDYKLRVSTDNGVTFTDLAPDTVGTGRSFIASGLVPETTYVFKVEALDAAGNVSTDGPASSPVTTGELVVGANAVLTGLAEVTGNWQRIDLPQTFADPIVVAGPPSEQEVDPGAIAIRAITPSSFEIRFREWDYLDGVHGLEQVAYVVAERGVTSLPSGGTVEAGTVRSGKSYSSTVSFEASFSARPAFAVTMASQDGPAVAPKIRRLNNRGFQHATVAEEDGQNSWQAEDMNWLAWAPGSEDGTADGFAWETTTLATDENFRTANFGRSYTNPCVLGETHTVPPNPATIRHRNLTGGGIDLRMAEEQSRDTEILLGNETINLLIAECQVLPPEDETPPDWSGVTLSAPVVTDTAFQVSYAPGADDPKLDGYRVKVDGTTAATAAPGSTNALVTGLAPETTYSVTVEAFDQAGNSAEIGPIAVTTTDDPPPNQVVGTPYGTFMHFTNTDELMPQHSGGYLFLSTPTNASQFLEQARATGTRLVINLALKSDFQNGNGTFNFGLWKAEVDKFAGFDFAPYVADGTIVAFYLVDEPKAAGAWGGSTISNSVLDQMSAYAKNYWPTMPTAVRQQPTKLAQGSYQWTSLDIAWVNFNARSQAPIGPYLQTQIASAQAQNLGLVMGLQMMVGGDGSSGLHPNPPLNTSRWMMSYEEIMAYGTEILGTNEACAFISFRYQRYDETYFEGNSDLARGLHDLKPIAEATTPGTCGLRR